jgi:hypothetical protein
LCACALRAAVQEVRGDRASGPGELRQVLWPSRRHRRRRRPEQGNDRVLTCNVLLLFAFAPSIYSVRVSLVVKTLLLSVAHCEM